MFEVDYNKIDPKFKRTVESIEAKPHVRYIRYLLTKRYSPATIKQELFRLGLSAPHEPQLTAYYLCVVDPLVKEAGVGKLYSDYKNKLLRHNKRGAGEFSRNILNYRLDIGDDLDLQVKFNKFVSRFDVAELWINEIYKYHGSASRMPIDEKGNRILNATASFKVVDKILMHEKRYLIDKMILENVNDSRIVKYCRENLKMAINDYDIAIYKRAFFNIKTQSIEDRIQALEFEKNSLETLLSDIANGADEYETMDMGEKILIKKQTEQRISELQDNIKTLNMMYSEYAFKVATEDHNDFEKMFTDVVVRGYRRFCDLDNYKDRDIVDPLFKTARMMSFAHDKVEAIKLGSSKSQSNTDRSSQQVLMELYKQRIDEIAKEQSERASKELVDKDQHGPLNINISPDNIAGIEELGVSFEINEEKEQG